MTEMEFKPKRFSEANVQAEFYLSCRKKGINCFLEYRSSWNGQAGCRFDAVVHDGTNILAIIETKSVAPHRLQRRYLRWNKSPQAQRYSLFGIPVFPIFCIKDIPQVIKQIEDLKPGTGGNLKEGG